MQAMRLHRFYIQNDILKTLPVGDQGTCTNESIVFQISKVLRLQTGDIVYLFNEHHEYACVLVTISKKSFDYKVQSVQQSKIPSKKTYLVQSLVKKDKFEFIVQKATELGVTHILPIISERSEKKGIVIERLDKIRIEAMEQSGWASGPVLEPTRTLDEALTHIKGQGIEICYLDMNGETYKKGSSMECVCIGPEGGWGGRDVETFKKHDAHAVRLEGGVLRAETAAVVGAFLLTQ